MLACFFDPAAFVQNQPGPTASLNNRNFGRILSAGSPRILQFALRYTF